MVKGCGKNHLPCLFTIGSVFDYGIERILSAYSPIQPPSGYRDRMTIFKKFIMKTRDFFVAYPAVLSGYLIYMYFFFTTLEFYKNFRTRTLDTFDIFNSFDALLWMWLLSFALVKIIQFRERAHKNEKLAADREIELQKHRAQLDTMQQVTRALQHSINNPLTIVYAYAQKMLRKDGIDPDTEKGLTEIKIGAERISKALKEYSQAKTYQTIDTPVGKMATPGDGQ